MILTGVLNCLLDTIEQAKSFVSKTRFRDPFSYTEEDTRPRRKPRRLNDRQKEIADINAALKIKVERVSNLKKALYFLNVQNDKYDINDVEEYDDLLSDDDEDTEEFNTSPSPSNCVDRPSHSAIASIHSATNAANAMDFDLAVEPSTRAVEVCNDVIEIGGTQINAVIRTGVDPVHIDQSFSLEYTFVADVSSLELIL